jgi:hypothetical protein
VDPIFGLAWRLGAPTDESRDLETLAFRQGGAELAEYTGVEGALGGGGVEVDFDSANAGKAGGLEEGIGRGEAGGLVVFKAVSGLNADYGFGPDGGRNENSLVARDDGDFVGYIDAFGEEGDTDALRVGGAQIFRFFPCPEDDGRRLGWGVEMG